MTNNKLTEENSKKRKTKNGSFKHDIFDIEIYSIFVLDKHASKSVNSNAMLASSFDKNHTAVNLTLPYYTIGTDLKFPVIANNNSALD